MHIRRYITCAGLLAALFAFTVADASAQPLAGTRLGPTTIAGTLGQSGATTPLPVRFYFRFGFGYPSYHYYPRYRYRRHTHRRYRSHRRYNRREGRSCSYWSRRCIANWGYNNSNYRGCLRYYSCY